MDMTMIRDIFDTLCRWAPLELQLDFDNAGFLVGRGEREVHRVLLALDITLPVIREAADWGAELIVSHHPLIFEPLKSLTAPGPGQKALLLAEEEIGAICMHTNLDIAQGGVNDVLIRLLGAEPEGPLDAEGCGRVGTLPETMNLDAFLAHCRDRLRPNGLRYVDGGRPVRRLAVMGGAGGSALSDALAAGCDTYVTADVKYHIFLDAAEQGLNLIDADHFSTENPVIPVLAARLQAAFPALEIRIAASHGPLIQFC
jgi:dinuclear metal center YbgI/SA1388 family protein